jgi:hypothetical protein
LYFCAAVRSGSGFKNAISALLRKLFDLLKLNIQFSIILTGFFDGFLYQPAVFPDSPGHFAAGVLLTERNSLKIAAVIVIVN